MALSIQIRCPYCGVISHYADITKVIDLNNCNAHRENVLCMASCGKYFALEIEWKVDVSTKELPCINFDNFEHDYMSLGKLPDGRVPKICRHCYQYEIEGDIKN